MVLSIQELRAAMERTRQPLDVDVPGLGVVRLRQLDAQVGLRIGLIASNLPKECGADSPEMLDFMIALLAESIVDESGALAFGNNGDRALLKNLSAGQLMALGNAAMELNGISEGEAKKN